MLEIRPCYTLEDLSDIAPEVEFEREARLRKEVARQQKAKSAKGKSKSTPPARKKSAKKKSRRAKAK